MIRGLLKLIVLVAVLVAIGVFFLGWNLGGGDVDLVDTETREAVGTAGATAADKGREIGAEAGERAGQAADQTRRALADASLTTKIKAKMALDDVVKARNLDVDTAGGVVTLKGTVHSEEERQRALALARETEGVRQVVDQLSIR